MQQKVRQMVTQNSVTPQPVFNPKCTVQQRIILLGCTKFEPDAFQAIERLQSRLGHMCIVIPDEFPIERRQVDEK